MTRAAIAAVALAGMLPGYVTAGTQPTAHDIIAGDTAKWGEVYNRAGHKAPDAPLRWAEKHAVIQIEGRIAPADRQDLARAVGILNSHLPPGSTVSVGRTGARREYDPLENRNPKPGAVILAFLPRKLWPEPLTTGPGGVKTNTIGIGMPEVLPGAQTHHIQAGWILVDSDRIRRGGPGSVVAVILHEFLHVTGRMHPRGANRHARTIMNHGAPLNPPNYLYPLDIEVLQMLHGRTSP